MNRRIRLLVLVVGVGLAASGCGGSSDETSPAETTTTTIETTTTETQTTAETTTTAAAQWATITIVVAGGRPQGGIQRPSVQQGARVLLVVRSDVADEVHVHGYDLMKDVEAGGTVHIRFEATIPGRFEVELEDLGLQLAELTVRQ